MEIKDKDKKTEKTETTSAKGNPVIRDESTNTTIAMNEKGNRFHDDETGEMKGAPTSSSSLPNAEKEFATNKSHVSLNDTFFEPYFRDVIMPIIVERHMKGMFPLNPNERYAVVPGNKFHNLAKGIDCFFNIYDETNELKKSLATNTRNPRLILGDFRNLSIDVKTREYAINRPEFFEHPKISLNLFKTNYGDKSENPKFVVDDFLNKEHENNAFAFVIPKTNKSKGEIEEDIYYSNQYKFNPNDYIQDFKYMLVKSKEFKKYISNRILNTPQAQNIINLMKYPATFPQKAQEQGINVYHLSKNDPNTLIVDAPVLGKEGFNAQFVLMKNLNNTYSIRVELDYDMFDKKDQEFANTTFYKGQKNK